MLQVMTFRPPIYGAYSELYAVLSPELKVEHNGGYLVAWGRVGDMGKGIAKGLKSKSEGGTGAAETFMEYCDRETKRFL
jgi:retinol dehydrogenase-12